jgi:galactokinase
MEAAKILGVSLLVEVSPPALVNAEGRMRPAVFKRARHIVGEIARVDAAVLALRAGDLAGVGRLLTASHRSSQNLFENSTPELDFLVDALTNLPQVHGARLTGGGFGGAVMALTGASFGETQAAGVASAYEGKFGRQPDVLHMLTDDGAQVIAPAGRIIPG